MNRQYRYYDFVMAAFVCVLLCSNLIGASKVASVEAAALFFPISFIFGASSVANMGSFTFGAGVLFFPISYIFGDVLTEVYGYARARRVVWAGFSAMIFASFMSWFVLQLPPAPGWPHQEAFATVFGSTGRIVLGSLVAFFSGEFCNSYVLAKMKILTKGKYLWMRTIGSTIVGEGVDSLIFYPLAFYGTWPNELVWKVMVSNYFIKVGWETVITPFTYLIVNWLKRHEHEDYFDHKTNFNPFTLKA